MKILITIGLLYLAYFISYMIRYNKKTVFRTQPPFSLPEFTEEEINKDLFHNS